VTLSCIMTYRWLSEYAVLRPGATMSASISWESAAGTFLSQSSTDFTNSRGITIGETLQVNVTTLASGNEIPSYNCATSFHFTGQQEDRAFSYAHNNVSWTCVSDPVITWCMYISMHDSYLICTICCILPRPKLYFRRRYISLFVGRAIFITKTKTRMNAIRLLKLKLEPQYSKKN